MTKRKELLERQARLKKILHSFELKLRDPFPRDKWYEQYCIRMYRSMKTGIRITKSELLKTQEELRG